MHSTRSRAAAVIVATLAVIAAGIAAVALMQRPEPVAAPSPTASAPASAAPSTSASPSSTGPSVQPTEPTEPAVPEPSDDPTADPLAGTTLTVTFSGYDAAAGALVVGGYLDAVLEGGTCTLTATKDGTVLTGTSTATPDASSTSCGSVSVRGPGLTSGTWSAALSFTTAGHLVAAAPVSIEVSP